jgi:cyclopropane-fatty-acyl-phospholipid synthase
MTTDVSATPSATRDRLLRKLQRALAESPRPFTMDLPSGERVAIGTGTPCFNVSLRDRKILARLATLDEGRIAEAYLAGDIDIEGDLLAVMQLRDTLSDRHYLTKVWRFVQPIVFGQVGTNARAIHAHYDLDADFFLSFLGEARCYTHGIFESDDEPLSVAIHRKFDIAIEACDLGPGSRILEVGPGWGAFTEYAARRGIHVTGVTNSVKSQEFLRDLGERQGLEWNIAFSDILDYRPDERYDAIVVMGIMEHLPDYPRVLAKFQELLKPRGRVYLDASAARKKYDSSYFLTRYIYGGNHTFLELADFFAALAKTPFQLRSVHEDRHSFFLTFKHWAENWEANRKRIVDKFGEADFRRFQLYLWAATHCFQTDGLQCYRVVLDNPA